jgi:predicted Zn-dependent protease
MRCRRYKRLVSIAPNCAPCHETLGRALVRAGKNLEAQTALEDAVKLEPKNASFHYELGRLYQKTGDSEGAKRELELSKQMYGEKASSTGQDLPKPPEGVPPSLWGGLQHSCSSYPSGSL